MKIQITCLRPGFRRCGLAHPALAEYPADRFTEDQLRMLKAEPMLVVTELPDAPPADEPTGTKKSRPTKE